MVEVLRYAAFAEAPGGGNPAGVVLDARGLDGAAMQAIASELGYSETAFLRPAGKRAFDVRYFSPAREVPFCGHATIAAAVAHAERSGAHEPELTLHTRAGRVPVRVARDGDGLLATLTTVAPSVQEVDASDLSEALAALAWSEDELDTALPPRAAYAGALHLVLAAATRSRLARLDYDFERLRALMLARGWLTVALVHRRGANAFDARNAFAVGGVVEDPATGAAAGAFGAYLRALGLIQAPARVTIHQGQDMGRPSVLLVDVPAGAASPPRVSGRALAIT